MNIYFWLPGGAAYSVAICGPGCGGGVFGSCGLFETFRFQEAVEGYIPALPARFVLDTRSL